MNVERCWQCGNFTAIDTSKLAKGSSKGRRFCSECVDKFEEERSDVKNKYIELKVLVTLERALRIIERQQTISLIMDNYYDAYQIVSEFFISDSKKFDSAHEVATCIELLRNKIKVKAQYAIGRKKVDFLLPDLKVALEIDGGMHRFKVGKDSQRDTFILNELNKNEKGWEIIRIPTSLVEKDVTKLVPTIKILYKEKQNLRRKYNGFIPTYYSRTNKMAQIEALNGILPEREIEEMKKETLCKEEYCG